MDDVTLEIHRVCRTTISERIVWTQTVHLSCFKVSTISKQTKMSIHLSLVTYEYHRVRPKWFLSLWYVWRKPCTYLALRLTLSPNRLKWHSTWPRPPRRSIECVQQRFPSIWYVRRKLCTYLALTLTRSRNGPKWDSTWPMSPKGSIGCVQNDFFEHVVCSV
jgi:hypothetical protein